MAILGGMNELDSEDKGSLPIMIGADTSPGPCAKPSPCAFAGASPSPCAGAGPSPGPSVVFFGRATVEASAGPCACACVRASPGASPGACAWCGLTRSRDGVTGRPNQCHAMRMGKRVGEGEVSVSLLYTVVAGWSYIFKKGGRRQKPEGLYIEARVVLFCSKGGRVNEYGL